MWHQLDELTKTSYELDEVQKELLSKSHIITTRGNRRLMEADCTCGWVAKRGRGKVVSDRVLRHQVKTGHIWEPSR